VCVFVFAPVDLFACLLTVLCIVCIAMRINILIVQILDTLTEKNSFRDEGSWFQILRISSIHAEGHSCFLRVVFNYNDQMMEIRLLHI